MKKRTTKRPSGVSQQMQKPSIPGWQPFHADVVIHAIDEALNTVTDAKARCRLKHSRQYMTEFEQRHPFGVIPRLMDKDEFRVTFNVLRILKHYGVTPPKDGFKSDN